MKILLSIVVLLLILLNISQHRLIENLEHKVNTVELQYKYIILELTSGDANIYKDEYLITKHPGLKEK